MLRDRPLEPFARRWWIDQRIKKDSPIPAGQDERFVLRDRPAGSVRQGDHAEIGQLTPFQVGPPARSELWSARRRETRACCAAIRVRAATVIVVMHAAADGCGAGRQHGAPLHPQEASAGTFPAHLPRERVVIPGATACPCCGGKLSKLGETITETLEVVPRQWKVIQTVREKFTCRSCEKITQPPAPFHVIPRGHVGPSLLAMILYAKYGEHQPLNRQSDVYAREGIELDVSMLADHVGTCTAVLHPLYELIRRHVLAAERIHGDDTTVPVLAKNKTAIARLWTYVRDDRPFGGLDPPAAVFFYSPNRGGEHPARHLADYAGILQADAYAGFGELYHGKRKPAPITEAACWSHGRRKFFELADLRKAPLATEAVRRIDELFAIERMINGRPNLDRLATRQRESKLIVVDLEQWMRTERGRLSRHAETAKAIDYMLTRWPAFTRFLDDGRICLTNNAAERALRGIALGRRA